MKEYILWLFAFVYVMEFMFVPWLIISYSPVMLFPDTSTQSITASDGAFLSNDSSRKAISARDMAALDFSYLTNAPDHFAWSS
ncbi:hypothetical protein [Paraburkholderia sp. EB58]|uniref:hypothetical protein n=1 Tax=Paraburkholderia sp. EB58 TaxID=3035125 RepID=UPI003D1CE686